MTLVVAGYNFEENPFREIDNIKEITGVRAIRSC
jgi:hypothetical protein|tara:strand:+ start:596 stop:697 length:102 start_codon:yes stop_codon:yes gene_type:complete